MRRRLWRMLCLAALLPRGAAEMIRGRAANDPLLESPS